MTELFFCSTSRANKTNFQITPQKEINIGRFDLGLENEKRISRQHFAVFWSKNSIQLISVSL